MKSISDMLVAIAQNPDIAGDLRDRARFLLFEMDWFTWMGLSLRR